MRPRSRRKLLGDDLISKLGIRTVLVDVDVRTRRAQVRIGPAMLIGEPLHFIVSGAARDWRLGRLDWLGRVGLSCLIKREQIAAFSGFHPARIAFGRRVAGLAKFFAERLQRLVIDLLANTGDHSSVD